MPIPSITGCSSASEAPKKKLIGGTNAQNYALLLAQYVKSGSRKCEQYALLSGCGCASDVTNTVGFVKKLNILNKPDPNFDKSMCETQRGAAKNIC